MKFSPRLPHYVMAACAALAAGALGWAQFDPSHAAAAHALAAAAGAFVTSLGAFSGSSMQPKDGAQ